MLPIHILLGLVTAFQSAGYGLILGALGIFLGKKTGLWKDEKNIQRTPLLITLLAAFFGWFYHKYGLRYVMIGHAGCHLVSKLIWLLFL